MTVVAAAVTGALLAPLTVRAARGACDRPSIPFGQARLASVPLLALTFGVSAWATDGAVDLMVLALLATTALLVSLVDLAEHRIPDVAVAAGLLSMATLIAVTWGWGPTTGDVMLSAVTGAVGFGAALLVPHLIRPDGLGFGDVKLAVVLGFAIGAISANPARAVVGVGWALIVASTLGLGMAAIRRATSDDASGMVPFAPPLSLAAVVVAVGAAALN